MVDVPTVVYPSIEDFYSQSEIGPKRRFSGECDFGVWWRDGNGYGPWWRMSVVKDTGEVYIVCQAGYACPEAGRVEVLGVLKGDSYETAEKVYEGWAEVCGQPDCLSWIRERSAAHLLTTLAWL